MVKKITKIVGSVSDMSVKKAKLVCSYHIFFPRLGPFITVENRWDPCPHFFVTFSHVSWGISANVSNYVWLLTTHSFTNSNLVSLIFQVEYVMHYYGIAHCVCFGVGLGANVLGKVNIWLLFCQFLISSARFRQLLSNLIQAFLDLRC